MAASTTTRRAAPVRSDRRRRAASAVAREGSPEDQLAFMAPAGAAEGSAVATPAPSLAERLRAEAAAPITSPTAACVGGGLTLDELLVGAWEGLSAHRTVSCPVCSGAMSPRSDTGRETGAGRCGDCGTELR